MKPYSDVALAKRRQDYNAQLAERQRVIRENAGRRIKRQPQLPVPAKPEPVLVPVAYEDEDGTYFGRLDDPADCPAFCVIRWEAI